MENPQQQHFENLHDLYADHYYDEQSTRYRKQFIYDLMFQAYRSNEAMIVADICCGDGYNTQKFKEYAPDTHVDGFDISPTAIATYRQMTGGRGEVVDLTRPIEDQYKNRFDLVFCVGGIHHCVLNLPQLVLNVSAMLKEGGHFICMEPYASPLLDPIRKLWYRFDPYFDASSERALVPDELSGAGLELRTAHYGGGPAFYFVNNSMIFRMPKPLKRAITPPLLAMEPVFEKVLPRALKGFFIADYVKKA